MRVVSSLVLECTDLTLFLKNKAGAAFPDDARDSFCFDFF
jgi:hypothetical protein